MKTDATAWFRSRGWKPFPFQRTVWRAIGKGQSGLLHATTGSGKTYAVWLGAVQAFAAIEKKASKQKEATAPVQPARAATKKIATPLTVLWITPMRALAADTLRALVEPLAELAPHWSAGMRTGDISAAERAAQSRRMPTVLVTTPESLSLLLARADAKDSLHSVQLVVADEWHELLGNKRGVQLQLAIARLAGWNPKLAVWGMSATLGNLNEAMTTLLPARDDGVAGTLVQGKLDKRLIVDTLLPKNAARFSWAGHLGLGMLPQVVAELESSSTTLVFVNVRSQAELWYKAILDARPDWAGVLAIHHGSLDRGVRDWVEAGLKAGSLKAVVCTSSLDLGVDFLPVERVLQIGSPKGVARLLQRAGRSGHAPGRPSRITLVPTHSLEIIEFAAARAAMIEGQVERRASPHQPVDVLVQHLCTVALGGGFTPDALYAEVRRTAAYRHLPPSVWQWCLDFVSGGGPSLGAYPDYHRVQSDEEGIWRLPDARLARRHRSNIGTIVSDAAMTVQILGGKRLGTMEESFLSRLQSGNVFVFAGRVLELVRIEQMTAFVRRATSGKRPTVPRWGGSRMAISTVLAESLVRQMALAAEGKFNSPELKSVRPLLEVQQRWSALPTPETLLVETLRTREGWHLFVYPFAGRHAHLGLASLFAWRAAQIDRGTFSIAINDYGFELISPTPRDWAGALLQLMRLEGAPPPEDQKASATIQTYDPRKLRNVANANAIDEPAADAVATGVVPAAAAPDPARAALLAEILASLNHTEMARRRFREIARVSGLIFQSHPGEKRSARQLQASAQLFFDVFQRYDDANLLLRQADDEVLSQELDVAQLLAALRKMQAQRVVLCHLERPTPFCFPLMIERFRERLTNELLAERIARMVTQLEEAADARTSSAVAREAARTTASADGAGETPAATPKRAPRPAAREMGSGNAPRSADAAEPTVGFDFDEDRPRFARRSPPPAPATPAEQAAANAVRRQLDFSLTPVDAGPPRKSRRARKPSRPLPPL